MFVGEATAKNCDNCGNPLFTANVFRFDGKKLQWFPGSECRKCYQIYDGNGKIVEKGIPQKDGKK